MGLSRLVRASAVALISMCIGCPGPFLRDIGPNQPASGDTSSAGLTIRLAGGSDVLYAVTLDAGVWRRANGAKWTQLANSPRGAITIAVEPKNHNHLVVGERNGNSVDVHLNQAGIWESGDGGATWTYALDPLTIQDCKSQAIADVVFTSQSHIVAATGCGVVHRTPAGQWSFPTLAGASGPATALAVAGIRVWARTASGQLYLSSNDGASFDPAPIDPTTPLPPTLLDQGPYPSSNWKQGLSFSIAALGDEVYMPARGLPSAGDNELGLVTYNLTTTKVRSDVLGVNDGRGDGGWVFVRAGTLASKQDVIVFSNADYLFLLTKDTHTAGPWQWKHRIIAACDSTGPLGLCPDGPPSGFGPRMHSDMWDALINTNSVYGEMFLSSDGGVYHYPSPSGSNWVDYDDGLHTLHAHTLDIVLGTPGVIATPTSDNDAWYGSLAGTNWKSPGCCGDGNWTASDEANPAWTVFARSGFDATLTRLDGGGGGAAQVPITTSPLFWFQLVQTMTGDVKQVDLDAVMLVGRPLPAKICPPAPATCQPVTGGKLAALGTGTGPALIRNRQWQKQPNVNAGWGDWTIEATDLPAGTFKFFATGGHTSIVYYLLSNETDPSGNPMLVLYRRKSLGGWEPVLQDIPWIDIPDTDPPMPFAPVWVNPYNAVELWAMRRDGIYSSKDQGSSFHIDPVLTALVTQSGRYALTGPVVDVTSFDAKTNLYFAGRANATTTLADLRFARSDPSIRVAAGAETGVFYDRGDGIWRDLTPVLPKPLTTVSGVTTDGSSVYVSFDGRSVIKIDKPGDAKLASYFTVDPGATGGVIAKLMRADGKPIAGAQVKLLIIDPTARSQFPYDETTGTGGEIGTPVPLSAAAGGAVYLDFAGDKDSAPAQTRFVLPSACSGRFCPR